MKSCDFVRAAVLCLLAAAPGLHGAEGLDLNGSFEARDGQIPKGWKALRGAAAADRRFAHDGRTSLRLEPTAVSDACVQSPLLKLTVGKRYEAGAWVRTERVEVRDLDRSPIAVGATLSLASAPFDIHSESVGGTRNWTRLRLRFTATRSEDHILLSVGLGGRFEGRAWFDSVSLEDVSSEHDWPARQAVRTFGPAYRYPAGGWIYLHIEGEPYERGYQHGYLMASEIGQYLNRCALQLDPKSKERAWETGRTVADALFLRGFDKEILQEMKGIADGAKAAGAKWTGRDLDLLDIVAANTLTELSLLRSASQVTPTGLEGLHLRRPGYAPGEVPVTERCSAFAATGPATRNGKMVIGHITMWSLSLAEQTNVMLDVKPLSGHRVLMQSFPGGIQSGTDYYQNDAGVVLVETTIRQSPFNIRGTPVAFRARKAIQYGTDIDKVVEHLSRDNNGLYTNEWIIGDAKDNQIAMFELGTNRTKLYRSSRNEWFGGTEGFYWGCNNAKDLGVRLESKPDPKGPPSYVPFVPNPRDIKWQELYERYKGAIDEQFAFLAFRTAPLVSSSSMDAKVTTSEMASRMMCWAVFGKPNQREWAPDGRERESQPQIFGLYSGGYRLIQAEPSAALQAIIRENEKARLEKAKAQEKAAAAASEKSKSSYKERLWQGWVLPATDSELWLTAGSAAYYRALESDDLEKRLQYHRAEFWVASAKQDLPLRSLRSDTQTRHWYDLAANKGALLFDALRRELGDDRFFSLMRDFFARQTTGIVTAPEFLEAVDKVAGKPMGDFFSAWLDGKGLPGEERPAVGLVSRLYDGLDSALLVYGTAAEAGANRFAAEQLQRRFLNWFESEVPIRKDFEVSEEELQFRNIVFVGRPETNSALAAWKEPLGLEYDAAVFRIDGAEYASENEGLLLAAPNPLEPSRMVVVLAGNSPAETVRLSSVTPGAYEYAVFKDGKQTAWGFRKRAAKAGR